MSYVGGETMNKKLLLGIGAVAIMATSAAEIYAKANKGLTTRAAGAERTIMFEYSKNTDFKDSSMTSSQTELGYDVDCLFYANQSETYSFGAKDEVFEEERWFVSKDYDTPTVSGGSQICIYVKGAVNVEINADMGGYLVYAFDDEYNPILCGTTCEATDSISLSVDEGHTIYGVQIELPWTNGQSHFITSMTITYNVADCLSITNI